MFNMMHSFVGPASSRSRNDLLTNIQLCGLTSNLRLCLDAGDDASYSSGQKWLDVSGGGYDWFLGATSSSEASDPTFNGVAGRRSSTEYWSFDGADYFTYDTVNETWMNDLHKTNNSVAAFYATYAATDATHPIAATNNAAGAGVGFSVLGGAGGDVPVLYKGDSSGTNAEGFGTADTTYPRLELNAISQTIANGGPTAGVVFRATLQIDTDTFSTAFTFDENPPNVMKIGAWSNAAAGALPNGDRIYCLALWTKLMTIQEEMALMFSIRGKFSK